jgi:predicted ATP-binding protein involved in virulence
LDSHDFGRRPESAKRVSSITTEQGLIDWRPPLSCDYGEHESEWDMSNEQIDRLRRAGAERKQTRAWSYSTMRIDQLSIKNFKKFADQQFEFHPQFTLLVGENGAGKTSVLDALAIAAGIWLAEPPDTTLIGSRRNILSREIRLEPQTKPDRTQFIERLPVVVTAIGKIAGTENLTWTRQIRKTGTRTSNADAKECLSLIQETYRRDAAGENVLCPVIAYYGAGRAWLPSNERIPKGKINGPARRWEAFYDCFSERIRFSDLNRWFQRETTERGNQQGKWRPGAEAVRKAILACIPDATDVGFDTDRDQIVLAIEGQTQPFDNLSAGQRMLLAMVADLAIRVVTQNAFLLPAGELGADDLPIPRVLARTPGLVLIDELDVHLHPIWQRRIVHDLKRLFPAIQFVCASHSPQLIGELQPEEILLLRDGVPTHPAQSFGMDSNWVVEVIMGGSKANPKIMKRLNDIFGFLEKKQLAEAEQAAYALRGEIGNNDDLQRAVSMIDRIKVLGR